MNETLRLRPAAVLDPRGEPLAPPASLAQRRSQLAGSRILLFDNGKLQPAFGPYRALFERVQAALEPSATCLHRTRDLLVMDRPSLRALAVEISAEGFAGVVLALCDSGVTQPTILLAAELERAGVPCAAICLEPALELAAASAAASVPGLPLTTIAALRSASTSVVAAQADESMGAIRAGLTEGVGALLSRFQQRFPDGGSGLNFTDGKLILAAEVELTVRRSDGAAVVEIDPAGFGEELYERMSAAMLTDGFPVIAPTADRVARMLTYTDREPDSVLIAQLPPSGAVVTVQKLAIAAVMAGCRPEYFPFVLTAMEAMADERYRLFQAVITSHPGGNAVVISGPLAREAGIASGGGCLGPGYRANATIGRALSLCLLNVGRALPGRSDLAVLGSPSEFAYVLAEATSASPWSPLHVDFYDAETTSVTVHRCESPHNVVDHLSITPEGLLGTFAGVAATIGGNNAYMPSELLVIINPEHARIVASAGWSKGDVQRFLFEQARLPAAAIRSRGIVPSRPAWMADVDPVPVLRSPEDVIVVVAGGPGVSSALGIPWGYARAITRPVAHQDGRPVKALGDLKRR